jgi:hypothetical protein
MKQRLVVLLVVTGLLASAVAFASGSTETQTSPWETISVTGRVSFKDYPHPEITSGAKTYELMVPAFSAQDLEVKAGDTITVEGVLMDGRMTTGDEPILLVTKAVVNGKEYVLPAGYGGMGHGMGGMGRGGSGPRGGMGRWQ